MQPGLLKNKVLIKSLSVTTNDLNETIKAYSTTFATMWADIRSVNASKRFSSEREISYRSAVFISYYIGGITNEMKLLHDGNLWDIVGVAEIGYRDGIEITAEINESGAK
jgi:head-tail adaptor